jgi:hypothetical protein
LLKHKKPIITMRKTMNYAGYDFTYTDMYMKLVPVHRFAAISELLHIYEVSFCSNLLSLL